MKFLCLTEIQVHGELPNIERMLFFKTPFLEFVSIIFDLSFDSARHRNVLVRGRHDKCEFHRNELLIIF